MERFYTTIDCGLFTQPVSNQSSKATFKDAVKIKSADLTVVSKYNSISDIGNAVAELTEQDRELLKEYLLRRKGISLMFN